MKVLLIDDDRELQELLKKYLSKNAIQVITASSGEEGLSFLEKEEFHAVVLDVMMPDMNGFEVLKEIHGSYKNLPVIMLTARGDEIDRILGLELGADDYIVKPFSSRELLARIKAIKRLQIKLKKNKEGKKTEEEIYSHIIKLDMAKRIALVRGKAVDFSSLEFDLLSILVQNKGVVLSREDIMDLSRGEDFNVLERAIDVQISRLRQKIEKDPQKPKLIKTVWGVGYTFTGEDF